MIQNIAVAIVRMKMILLGRIFRETEDVCNIQLKLLECQSHAANVRSFATLGTDAGPAQLQSTIKGTENNLKQKHN